MISMANNLDAMILKAGMSKREVAALKGITPETLSRQIHGKIQMTLVDAEHYAKILDCTAQDVLFPMPPIELVGLCGIDKEGNITRDISLEAKGHIYTRFHNPSETAFVYWKVHDEYTGVWQYIRNGLESVLIDPIKNNYIHPNAKGFECYAMVEEPYKFCGHETYIAAGCLYPEPGNLYTIHNGDRGTNLRGQKLVWATPVLSMILRPELKGFDITFYK